MILTKVLPFKRRVQVLELNADTILAQKVFFRQIVVNLVLGLVQVMVLVMVVIVVIMVIMVMVVMAFLVVIVMGISMMIMFVMISMS